MVKVSALMIDVIPEPVDIPVLTGFAGAKKSIGNTPPLDQQMTSEDDLSVDDVVVADPKSRETFVSGPTSTTPKIAGLTVNLAGDVTAGVASSADLAEVVTVGVTSSADIAGDITAGVASSADLANVVTVGVAPSADLAGDVTAGVACSVDLAEVVTVGVASMADPDGDVNAGVTSMEKYKEWLLRVVLSLCTFLAV